MSHRTTTGFERAGEGAGALPADLPQTAQRSLVLPPPVHLVPTASPLPPGAAPGRTPVTFTAPHTRCQCPRCRKRRARQKAARTREEEPAYIDATIIAVSEEGPGGQASGAVPPWDATNAQAFWTGQQPPQGSRRRRFPLPQVCLAVALLFALVWLSGIADPLLASLFAAPTATIAILPASSRENFTVTVTAVTGQPGPTRVASRILQGSSPQRTVVARASGSGQTPATPASGTLTFFNAGSSPQTLGAGTILTGADGIQVVTDSAVTVPAGNPPTAGSALVSAHALQSGSQGNIAAGDVSGLCCGPGLAVKSSVFSGGQDEQTYPILAQRDIDAASSAVAADLTRQAQRQVLGQVSSSEQLAQDTQCHTSVAAAEPAGSHVAQASVSVSATCTGQAFDRVGALRLAAFLFAQAVARQLGPAYTLASRVTTRIVQAARADVRPETLTVRVQAQGTWCYQLGRAEQRAMKHRIAGKSVQAALSILAQEAGVAHSSISLSGGGQSIPNDPARIVIVILPAPGAPASATGTWLRHPRLRWSSQAMAFHCAFPGEVATVVENICKRGQTGLFASVFLLTF